MKFVRSDVRFDPKVVAFFGDPVYNGLPDHLPTEGEDYNLFVMIIVCGSHERKYVRPLFTERHLEDLWDIEYSTPFHFIVYKVPKQLNQQEIRRLLDKGIIQPR